MSEKKAEANAVGCQLPGCIVFILTVIALWAVCCGVTHDGRHYELECSNERGVEVETTVVP
jgi:hypothetical protein